MAKGTRIIQIVTACSMHLLTLVSLVFAAAAMPAMAAEPVWLGAPDCRIAPIEPLPTGAVSWTGGCAGGYASGKGTLAWTWAGIGKATLDTTLARGEASGEGILELPRFLYQGGTRNGKPEGQGYLEVEGWGWYEGAFMHGAPHGKGTHVRVDRSRYTGDWVNGARHGQGQATFTSGGSYTGSWKDDSFDGQGAIVYAGAGHTYEGLFEHGRVAGLPPLDIPTKRSSTDGEVSGIFLPGAGIVGYRPVKAPWDALTTAQKNTFIRNYPALEAGDEPPFPAKGEGYLLEEVQRINQILGPVKGNLSVYVLVGKDGKGLSVTSYGAPTATLVRALSAVFVREPYKPARCRGEPCEMVYLIHFAFAVAD